jgi:hypothetical protein
MSTDRGREQSRERFWERVRAVVRWTLLRVEGGPLRPLAVICAELFARLAATCLRGGLAGSAYARGSLGRGEAVVGLSDVDLAVVVSSCNHAARLKARWDWLENAVEGCGRFVNPEFYAESELPGIASTVFTFGLDERPPRSLFFPDPCGTGRAEQRPPGPIPYAWPMENWRLLLGRDLRPLGAARSRAQSLLLAWADLQFWWTHVFKTVADPVAPWSPYTCVKLVAEPARILIWLEHGEQLFGRLEVLRRALELFPEEEPAIRFALRLRANLRLVDVTQIEEALPCCVRLSARIADRLAAELAAHGTTDVALGGEPADATAMPLCDWPALVRPPSEPETFFVAAGRPDDPAALRAALDAANSLRYPTLVRSGLIVRPTRFDRGRLRTVAFALSDPVTAALIAGDVVASFPNVPGWSAGDVAVRALTEHAAWLRMPRARTATESIRWHGCLFSAARAGLLLDGIRAGEPVLPLTFGQTAKALADRLPHHRGAIEDSFAAHGASLHTGRPAVLPALRSLARALDELGCEAAAGLRRDPPLHLARFLG